MNLKMQQIPVALAPVFTFKNIRTNIKRTDQLQAL